MSKIKTTPKKKSTKTNLDDSFLVTRYELIDLVFKTREVHTAMNQYDLTRYYNYLHDLTVPQLYLVLDLELHYLEKQILQDDE